MVEFVELEEGEEEQPFHLQNNEDIAFENTELEDTTLEEYTHLADSVEKLLADAENTSEAIHSLMELYDVLVLILPEAPLAEAVDFWNFDSMSANEQFISYMQNILFFSAQTKRQNVKVMMGLMYFYLRTLRRSTFLYYSYICSVLCVSIICSALQENLF